MIGTPFFYVRNCSLDVNGPFCYTAAFKDPDVVKNKSLSVGK